jgi:hypothetical protein
MPITENNFTADELQAALTANPALAAQLKSFGEKANYRIRTADEEATFLSGFEKQKVDAKTFEFATGIEKDVLEASGEPKLENEKYHEYLKRVFGTTKQTLTQMKTELEQLKADPNKNTADRQRIAQLEGLLTTEKTTAGDKLKQKDAIITDLKFGFEIEKGMAKIRGAYIPGVPEFAIQAAEAKVIADIKKSMKEVEIGGKTELVILDAQGAPKLDPATYQPVTIEAELKERLADLIDKARVLTGTGTKQEQQQQQQASEGVVKDATGKITDVTSVPAEVKTKTQLHEYLSKLGLLADSEEFNKIYTKLGEKLPLR